jgi:hypothetical protein
VNGTVSIPQDAPGGVLHVRVERVDRADAAAETVARTRIPVPTGPGARSIAFELRVPAPDPRGRYSVRAHLATGAGEDVQRGDYVSTRSYPVLTRERGSQVRVALQRID